MALSIRQVAYKTATRSASRVKANFTSSTLPNSLIVAIGGINKHDFTNLHVYRPSGFSTAWSEINEDVELYMWYREGSPSLYSVEMYVEHGWGMQLFLYEIVGAAQEGALDEVVDHSHRDENDVHTESTGTTESEETIAIAAVLNDYASTTQSGFSGGFSKISDITTPSSDSDYERNRMTTHVQFANQQRKFWLNARLSSARDWAAGIGVFRSGIIGPARFTSKTQRALTTDGNASLTVFGQLKLLNSRPALTVSKDRARMGPFDYQYRINGWDGLLIGSNTLFHVEATEGLYGWQVRTSDDDLPRGDGALRGVDLESARQVLFRMNIGRGRDSVEENMKRLYNALVPQRNEDWELIWRHPGHPLKMMRCRPIDLLRERSAQQLIFSNQTFVLRAADPKHYAAVQKKAVIPVSPAVGDPTQVSVVNEGNSSAYPHILIKGPVSGEPISGIELVNLNGLYIFDVRMTIPPGSELSGDMEALVTGAPRSVITLDGQSKYGSWQLPREPFRLEPSPVLPGGENVLYLRTDPPGVDIHCELTYRDTWSG